MQSHDTKFSLLPKAYIFTWTELSQQVAELSEQVKWAIEVSGWSEPVSELLKCDKVWSVPEEKKIKANMPNEANRGRRNIKCEPP